MECEQCNTQEQTLVTLSQIAAGLLNFYVAAFSSYSIAELEGEAPQSVYSTSHATPAASSHRLITLAPDLSPKDTHTSSSSSASSPPSTSLSRICIPSQMTLGESQLDASESRILAEQLLADCLLGLDASLGDLETAIDDILHNDHAWQTSGRLVATKALVVETMNRLAKAIGQLRFEAASFGN
ncbi:uncharacterized protein LY89DRAFT_728001 [Mollisia scopiformis]|uniref:Uncharacterized protein n=1 Tax=Mollisia scopiformis TaxID=149040 RepID=A0A194XU49_MOLSC|nr:uncharacterized protein LY89DRAFT_728001 [Mollisia scopiformis]KUJ23232.1 hypothetical protein LY89DRAFT_728001 [Mollisia scopiformis]